jgi:hypothetical protein
MFVSLSSAALTPAWFGSMFRVLQIAIAPLANRDNAIMPTTKCFLNMTPSSGKAGNVAGASGLATATACL